MNRFDMRGLHAELDRQRQARGLTWPQVTAEINRPFEMTPSIPITAGTLRNMLNKRSVTSGVVLQVLRWLGRTPESFLSGPVRSALPGEQFPLAGSDHILRFDTRAIYDALQQERQRRSLTWQQVAHELRDFTPGMLTNLAGGPLIGFPRVMSLTQWLGRPAAEFVRACSR